MSLFAEFELPATEFALEETLQTVPEAVIEVERVVASGELLTPYFWVSEVSHDEFEAATEGDHSIQNLRQLDSFEEATLYRAEWVENIESLVYACSQVGAIILNAVGQADTWEVQLRFDDQKQLSKFRSYCEDHGITFRVNRLHNVSTAHTGRQYGLTEKQAEALVKAWEAGVFKSPARASLSEVAAELEISQQALSQRIRKGHDALIESTLGTESPPAE